MKFMINGEMRGRKDWLNYLNIFRFDKSRSVIMSEEWLGCRVSLDCGSLGFFQGVINRINLSEQIVTLEKPFQNGVSCKFPEITLNAADIEVENKL